MKRRRKMLPSSKSQNPSTLSRWRSPLLPNSPSSEASMKGFCARGEPIFKVISMKSQASTVGADWLSLARLTGYASELAASTASSRVMGKILPTVIGVQGGSARAGWRIRLRQIMLQFCRICEQLGHARQQTPCGAAVEDAMVETERDVSFHDRDKLRLGIVPMRNAAAGTHAQHQRLLWQGNRGRPGEAEGAEVGDGGDRAAGGVGGQFALVCQGDELVVALDQVLETCFIGIADHGNQHPIFGFNGKAEINGGRMNDL